MAPIFVTGISHKSAPVEVREALAIPAAEISRVLGDLRAPGAVREAMILSTRNRVEVYGAGEREDVADGRLFGLLCERRGIDAASVRPFVYTKALPRKRARPSRRCPAPWVNKILHSPISRLRESAREGSGGRWVGAVSELFALDLGDGSRTHDEARVGGPIAGGVSTHGIT